jgi:putative peptidoglycan lipid II flippase
MSRVTGLVREMVMAHFFGAGFANDAFRIGFLIPNLTRDLFAEGALSSAFIPAFVDSMHQKGRKEAAHLANLVATALIIVVGALCILGMIFAPVLVELLAAPFHAIPGKFEEAVLMTRIMWPFLLLVAMAAQVMGILNSCGQFGVPATASTLFNIFSLAAGLSIGWLGPFGVSPIEGMAWGVVIGGGMQLAWQIPSLRKQGFHYRPVFDWAHPGMKRILRQMGPAILGNSAVQINVTVNTYLATHILDPIRGANGPVSWLNYAFRFMQFPLGLFGVAIASATLTSISRSASSGNMDEFRRTLSRSLGMVFLLTIPSSVGLILLGESMIGAVYQGGKIVPYDTHQIALALCYYALGLSGYSALKVLTPAFYALNDSRTPMAVSLCSVAINYGVATTLIRVTDLRHAALALSTAVVANFGFLTLFLILRKRIGGIHGRSLAETVVKVVAASLLMGIAVWVSSHTMRYLLGVSKLSRIADLAVSIPIGVAIFYNACRFAKVSELELAIKAVTAPMARLRAKIR